jgi:ubiquinone/menaquinone biosynthesis C-methylase UbiE
MVSDQKWRKLLKKGGQINGVPLPGLPSEELQISTVGSSGGATINEAFHFYLYILDKARSRGSPITRRSRVLDFGVGWGRIIRCFMRETKRLYGVDVQPRFLDAAKETGCPAELSLIEPMGALPFRGGTFDLVYAYSVFTHLPLHVQRHWLSEIRRVMNPSGLFVATVQAPRFLVDIASVDLDDPHLHPWMRALHAALNDNVDPFRLFNEDGYIYFG